MNSIYQYEDYCKIPSFQLTKEQFKQLSSMGSKILNFQIPYRIPHFFKNNWTVDISMFRELMVSQQGFVLVTWKFANALSQWIGDRKCLEIMSGTGALAYALSKNGTNIIATDDYSWDEKLSWATNKRLYTEVEKIDAIEAIKKYKDCDIVILSWGYMDDTSYLALKQMRESNPSMIMLVIGEPKGGCTSDREFFNSIEEIEDTNFRKAQKEFYQFHGLNDFPRLVK